jgi:hypothetical protein
MLSSVADANFPGRGCLLHAGKNSCVTLLCLYASQARTYFVAGMTKVTVAFADSYQLASKSAKTDKEIILYYTILDGDNEIYESPWQHVAAGCKLMHWKGEEPMKKRFSGTGEGLQPLSLCLYRVVQKGGITAKLMGHKKHILLGSGKVPLSPVLEADGRVLQQSSPVFAEKEHQLSAHLASPSHRAASSPSPSKDKAGMNGHKSSWTALHILGMVQVTVQASQDNVERYRLLVPCFNDTHEHGQIATVADFTGKAILYLKIRKVHNEDEHSSPPPSKYESIIDIIGLDMTHKGQVATDVTAGSHSRSRLANNTDFHWATIKSKRRKHKKSKAEEDGSRVSMGPQKTTWNTDQDFRFKVGDDGGDGGLMRARCVV